MRLWHRSLVLSHFQVGSIVAFIRINDRIFADRRDRHELLGIVAAHCTGITDNRAEVQTNAIENVRVSRVHVAERLIKTFFFSMERICVFHDKFTAAKQPKARTILVAILRLNLIKRNRQLFVCLDGIAHDRRKGFLVRWSQNKVAVMTIFEFEKIRTVCFITTGLLPKFCRKSRRNKHFSRIDILHLFSDNRFNIAQNAICQRKICIHPRRNLLDVPTAKHQLVTDCFSIGTSFKVGINNFDCFIESRYPSQIFTCNIIHHLSGRNTAEYRSTLPKTLKSA